MWSGVFPAVTTKFTEDDRLDHAEMERCFGLQIDAGCDGLIVCGSLGEGPMLSHDEKLEVFQTARKIAGKRPVLVTINEAATRDAAALAKRAAKAGADGLIVSRAASSLRRGLLRVISELRPRYAEGAAEMLAGAFEIVIEVARLRDDRHRVLRVAEVLGADGGELDLADIFSFNIDRTASGGLIEGSFVPASTMPAIAELMRTRGAAIDLSQFTRPAPR